MIGLPKETPETIRKTIDFAKKLNCTYAQFAITMPFPGNKLYDEAVKSGMIQLDDTWDKFVYSGIGTGGVQAPVLTTQTLSADDLATASETPRIAFAPKRDLFAVPSSEIMALSIIR